jgi:hypothetical protein
VHKREQKHKKLDIRCEAGERNGKTGVTGLSPPHLPLSPSPPPYHHLFSIPVSFQCELSWFPFPGFTGKKGMVETAESLKDEQLEKRNTCLICFLTHPTYLGHKIKISKNLDFDQG